ncbi:antiviral RADAR system adenosine deaminase RdrB [Shewanella baltica]|uniref:antiviral RADAR system adenosine deaminase RdrB n=1 Tax=Shewanella baltica TaxID=62322 RepID=UPI003D79C293
MLKIDPKWAVPITFLASDRLLYIDLFNKTGVSINTSICQAVHDYSIAIGNNFRNQDIELSIESWLEHNDVIRIDRCLKILSDYFLTWQGHCFEVKAIRLEEWLSLCSLIDPSWIIGYAYKLLLEQDNLSINEAVTAIGKYQCPVALENNNNAYADNHAHLNGHGHTSLSMLHFAIYLAKKPKEDSIRWPRRAEYSIFESGMLTKSLLPILVAQLSRNLGSMVYSNANVEDFDYQNINVKKLKQNLILDLTRTDQITASQNLLSSSHNFQGKSANRWLMFCCGLLCKKNQSEAYNAQLQRLIRSSNILRNYMTVSGVGLSQFVEYFNFKHRMVGNLSDRIDFKSHSLSYDITQNIFREFRVGPDIVVSSENKLNTASLERLIKKLTNDGIQDNTHFVLHFLRSFDKNANKKDKEQNALRNTLYEQVKTLQKFSNSVTYSDKNTDLLNPLTTVKTSLDYRKWVRGYDVAGNENDLSIEFFAPALRVLRAAKSRSQGAFGSRLPKPFLTIHAGEDFSHLLSGLRAIDESVEFCNLQKDDRLGHALALGLDVLEWAKKQQRSYITVGEHLDNLVWCYQIGLNLSIKAPTFAPTLQLISHKIEHWSSYIYGECYSPNELFQAWRFRRNCPNVFFHNGNEDPNEWQDWLPDLIYLKQDTNAKKIWLTRLYSGNPELKSKLNDVISIDCSSINSFELLSNNFPLNDSISEAELKLYDAIQDYLIEKYSLRGIIIEACPTSNIYIGRLDHYSQHPIFRWTPPNADWLNKGERFNKYGLRSGPLKVCINTDDSALMPTTIANEHRIICEIATKHYKVGAYIADTWIKNIQKDGVDIFHRNHLK